MKEYRPEILEAWQEYNRRVTVGNIRVGCYLGFVLMPAGFLLDLAVYRELAPFFFDFRISCSLLIAVFYFSLFTDFGKRHYGLQGLILFSLPTYFMCLMILVRDGPLSPYYAGLNLVYLVLGLVLHWTLLESMVGFLIVMVMYSAACFIHMEIYRPDYTAAQWGLFGNNVYFLVLTGIIVATGNYFNSRLRFSEFASRFEVERNKKLLEENNQQLVELNRVKDRFFANISHELRTPLTLLLAPLESLLYRSQGGVNEETREVLKGMQANAMRLLKLINDLLDLVRLESGRLEAKQDPMELGPFVNGLYNATAQVADDKKIELKCEVEFEAGVILADRDKLEKVFLNLLFNALKFTPEGGRVSLRVRREGEELVFGVRDTGIGIAAKNLPYIFDRFWQADGSAKRKFQGVGIGLSLVKELIEIQGGSVQVTSREGEGTEFTVRLPYRRGEESQLMPVESGPAEESGAQGTAPGMQSQEWIADLYRRAELFPAKAHSQSRVQGQDDIEDTERYTVLIADDEPQMRSFLRSQLKVNYRVVEAVDGQDAVEKAVKMEPDLILMDLMMPRMDGFQACRELREGRKLHALPIILLTARADEEAKLDALEAGASDFLSKPFSATELHVRIKNLLEVGDYQRQLSRKNEVLRSTIEQLKETETQLVQSEKLASLGRLSAGIIHEINNPLNFTATGAFTLRRFGGALPTEQRGEYDELVQDLEDGIRRVRNIVTDLRAFTHPGPVKTEAVPLRKVFATALRFVSNEIGKTARIINELPEGITVTANRNRLTHVVLNLLQNAIDSVKKKSFSSDRGTIRIRGYQSAGRQVISIRDNGIGIPADKLDKVFDPFFTTKEVGEGMGLGLSICYRMMKQCGGNIRFESEEGEYCEAFMELPVVEESWAGRGEMKEPEKLAELNRA